MAVAGVSDEQCSGDDRRHGRGCHARLGPTIFYVQEGTATIRKDWDNSSQTYGTNGYFYESGREPFILENKPNRPATFVAVEILPASIGEGPSTVLFDD